MASDDSARALIIVDAQPTFTEGGSLPTEGAHAVVERIADFVNENADHYALIVTTQDWHIDPGTHFSDNPDFVDTWPRHGVAGTEEAELDPLIQALPIDVMVKKGQYDDGYSGFLGADEDGEKLENILHGAEIEDVDVVGLVESHCVKATAIDSAHKGWNTRVFADLTIPVSPELGLDAREQMAAAGVEELPSSEAFEPAEQSGVSDADDDAFTLDAADGVRGSDAHTVAADAPLETEEEINAQIGNLLDEDPLDGVDLNADFAADATEEDFDFSDIDYKPFQD
ncbi:MAG: isochorismatase family protein [Actinomycetaceae bacterium]|nr:isochorismatase family protein [Actinomycetaceae bacterium]MDY6083534.1 isochorismatase family protein [Actinomycetaceae bacterium]